MTAHGYGVSFWNNENTLNLHNSDDCLTLNNENIKPLNCTIYMNFMIHKLYLTKNVTKKSDSSSENV